MIQNINMDSIIIYAKKKMTVEDFKEKFGIEDNEIAIESIKALVHQGKISIYENKSDEQELLESMQKEELLKRIADEIDNEEQFKKQNERKKKLEDTDAVNIKLSFNTANEYSDAEDYIYSLGIEDVEQRHKRGEPYEMIIRNLTPSEYQKIALRYKSDRAIKKGVDIAGKTINSATDAVNYSLTKVVAPTAKIAGEAGLNLGKGLFHTAVKTGASLVNSGSKAVKETKRSLTTDPEMIRASREILEAKDGLLRWFRSKRKKSIKGIEIIDD